ncbi:GDP-mannose 4,6-dehydratase [Sphingosinicella sp.]|uniref:GDP-mannose 4,6-dehydratase n=1 Tax=Sphingosinicella sp. TaxID=1917971 RepID=UPI004037C019
MKRALICGISGQDGAYLAQSLLAKGYRVVGTTRGIPRAGSDRLRQLEIDETVALEQVDPVSRGGIDKVLADTLPDEIYYLAAQSSVWRSFASPVETFEASAIGLMHLLEAARRHAPRARIFFAASGDCFGETPKWAPATETSPFRPRSPYATAKCAGHHALVVSRLAYGQFACSGFLFTHESPLRSEDFALGKVVATARRIVAGSNERLTLGSVEVVRDWGWAPDYVEAMWRMLQGDVPEDFVIATGRSHRLAELVERVFAACGLDWTQHVDAGETPLRPTDIADQHADPSYAEKKLGWIAQTDIDLMARLLVQ